MEIRMLVLILDAAVTYIASGGKDLRTIEMQLRDALYFSRTLEAKTKK